MKNSLTSIEISQEFSNPSTMLLVVSEMTQLKEFFFKGFVDENVNHLDKLIALEKLSIEDLKYVKPYHVDVLRICASLKNLRNLTLIRIKMLPYDGPYSTLWSSLKYLHVQHCTFSELPDCPNIEYLNIENPTCDIVGYALKFILRNGKNLTELYEDSYPPIDANSFLDMLRSCPKLRLLCSPMEYIKLYSGYLSSMVEILKENGVTPENPLELIVSRRIKWKWFRRLLRCTPDNELIDLYHTW
ncbi:uncharacterized protein LOC26526342 isoform X2 [Drosophila erecta]|nr:uncharacterized protein LOC26526342 isoform X2 [Drosophila erecta]